MVLNAQQRAGADDIVAAILPEKFERSSDLRKVLDLIEENQGFTRAELLAGIDPADQLRDAVR